MTPEGSLRKLGRHPWEAGEEPARPFWSLGPQCPWACGYVPPISVQVTQPLLSCVSVSPLPFPIETLVTGSGPPDTLSRCGEPSTGGSWDIMLSDRKKGPLSAWCGSVQAQSSRAQKPCRPPNHPVCFSVQWLHGPGLLLGQDRARGGPRGHEREDPIQVPRQPRPDPSPICLHFRCHVWACGLVDMWGCALGERLVPVGADVGCR